MTLAVLAVGMLALAMVLVSSTRQTIDSRESNLISISISNAIENIRAVAFADVATTFGTGGTSQFWCTETGELSFVNPGDAPVSGTITIYATEDSIPATFAGMNGGYDLDEDGTIESTPTADYQLLPIRLALTSTLNGAATVVSVDYVARDLAD